MNKIIGCRKVVFRGKINIVLGSDNIEIGSGTVFGKYVCLTANKKFGQFEYSPFIRIGENCNFGDFLNITSCFSIVIEDDVLTGRWVTISDNSHGKSSLNEMKEAPLSRKMYTKGGVHIKKNVWIGDKVTILSGVTIGEGSIIGANSVVTKDVPPYSVVGGIPGRVIRQLNN